MSKANILLVDDDTLIQQTINEILSYYDYTLVAAFTTGEQAILEVQKLKPDLILMDIELGGYLDGIETSSRIRSIYNCPILYITGLSDHETYERSKGTDPSWFIMKPFTPHELMVSIDMALYRNATEKRLKEQEEWFTATLNYLGEGLLVTDNLGIIKYINPRASVLTGYSSKDVIGQKFDTIFCVVDEKIMGFLHDILHDAKTYIGKKNKQHEYESWLTKKNKELLPIYINVSCTVTEDEEFSGLVILFQDLTRQLTIEEQLKKISSAVEHNPTMIMIMDPMGEVEYINPRVTEITGFTIKDMHNENAHYLRPHFQKKDPQDEIWRAVSEGLAWKGERQSKKKNGSLIWEAITLSPIKKENTISYWLVIREDISEQKKSELVLHESEARFRSLFENAPVAFVHIDFTKAKERMTVLQDLAIRNIHGYFVKNQRFLLDCIRDLRILNINKAAQQLFGILTKEELADIFITAFDKSNYSFFIHQLEAIYQQKHQLEEETYFINSKIEKVHIHYHWIIGKEEKDNLFVLLSIDNITDKKATEQALQDQTHHLEERVKEQQTLFELNDILTRFSGDPVNVFRGIAQQLPLAFEYVDQAVCQITVKKNIYVSADVPESAINISEPIYELGKLVGSISIYYNDNKDLQFFKEEKSLLRIVSSMLTRFLDRTANEHILLRKRAYETINTKLLSKVISANSFVELLPEVMSDSLIASEALSVCIGIFASKTGKLMVKKQCSKDQKEYFPASLQVKEIYDESTKGKVFDLHQQFSFLPFDDTFLLVCPVHYNEHTKALLLLLRRGEAWEEEDKSALTVYCEILSSLWSKIAMDTQFKREHQFNRLILASVTTILLVFNKSGKIIMFNHAAEKCAGYTLQEVQHFGFAHLFIPEQQDIVEAQLKAILMGKPVESFELLLRSKDRRLHLFLFSVKQIKSKERVIYTLLSGNDITETRRKEELIKEREIQFLALLENNAIGVFRTTDGENGVLLQINKAFTTMLGYDNDPELLLVKEIDLYYDHEDRNQIHQELKEKGWVKGRKLRLNRKNGSTITVIINIKRCL